MLSGVGLSVVPHQKRFAAEVCVYSLDWVLQCQWRVDCAAWDTIGSAVCLCSLLTGNMSGSRL
jgi:hypothetical protein